MDIYKITTTTWCITTEPYSYSALQCTRDVWSIG